MCRLARGQALLCSRCDTCLTRRGTSTTAHVSELPRICYCVNSAFARSKLRKCACRASAPAACGQQDPACAGSAAAGGYRASRKPSAHCSVGAWFACKPSRYRMLVLAGLSALQGHHDNGDARCADNLDKRYGSPVIMMGTARVCSGLGLRKHTRSVEVQPDPKRPFAAPNGLSSRTTSTARPLCHRAMLLIEGGAEHV